MPEGAAQSRRTVNTLVKALARAFRWKRVLESGEFTTIAELAEHEGIAPARARDCLGDPGREAGPGGDGGEVARAICGVIGGATAVRRVIDAIGPKETLIVTPYAEAQLHQTRRSCIARHFGKMDVGSAGRSRLCP